MTDQLEHDLRTMLAARAATVTADPATSEDTIADRLRAGDDAVAVAVPLAGHPPRGRWLLVAAAAAVLLGGVAVTAVVTRDDEVRLVTPPPSGDPVIFTAPGDAEAVALAYLADRLEAPIDAIELQPDDGIGGGGAAGFDWIRADVDAGTGGFVGLLERDGRWAVLEAFTDGASIDVAERDVDSVTVRTTGPAGSHVQLSIHRLSGESLTAGGCGGAAIGPGADEPTDPVTCSLVDEPVHVGDEPLTVRFSVVTQDGVRLTLEERLLLVGATQRREADRTIGRDGDAPKDVAERVALELFGEEYVTTAVEPGRDSQLVVMEGPSGVLNADVWTDSATGRWRVLSISSPELAPLLADGLGRTEDGHLSVEAPVEGILTVTGLDAGLEPLGETSATRVEPGAAYQLAGVEPWLDEAIWLRVSIRRADGDRLLLFGAA